MLFYLSNTKSNYSLFYGMNRESVRKLLNQPYEEFKKTEFSTSTSDNFMNLNIICFYDDDDLLEEVEIFSPNIFYDSISLKKNWFELSQADLYSYLIGSGNFSGFEIERRDDEISISSYMISILNNNEGLVNYCYFDLNLLENSGLILQCNQ